MADTEHGKKAEQKIREWLDRPQDGYSFDRIPDQMNGFYQVSRNICDFACYKFPYMYYIESKCTYNDNIPFSCLTDKQRDGLLLKSQINGTYGFVIVLFQSYKRAFVFNIQDIVELIDTESSLSELFIKLNNSKTIGQLKIKSLNIKKIDKWPIPYKEIKTIPNNRKEFLDYEGEIEEYIPGD